MDGGEFPIKSLLTLSDKVDRAVAALQPTLMSLDVDRQANQGLVCLVLVPSRLGVSRHRPAHTGVGSVWSEPSSTIYTRTWEELTAVGSPLEKTPSGAGPLYWFARKCT